MSSDIWSEIETAGAKLAVPYLKMRRPFVLAFVEHLNEVGTDDLLQAIEKNEPGGFQMSLVKGILNKILSGLSADEQAALPKAAGDLYDYFVGKVEAVANG